jgi:hypothetical protein
MTVFISHKKEDEERARLCALRLKINKISYYLDTYDQDISNIEDITLHLVEKIRSSSHLIVLLSRNTKGSWWVPFEIGVATAMDKRICSVSSIGNVEAPDYLSKWPILELGSSEDFKSFAVNYRADITAEENTLDSTQPSIRPAAEFHRKLKQALGQ